MSDVLFLAITENVLGQERVWGAFTTYDAAMDWLHANIKDDDKIFHVDEVDFYDVPSVPTVD